ncbi:MAG: hypothetical protein DRQ39_00325 [Gammaproteobacteria bacterium]|nr:MAG: hypothetical protein DRQ39_00325 [Gammaproteobacteria bacterium]RKZ95861.1 MAG: hypothetical protein DRQ40_02615 [Gammaproteobacteria bacterium]RLA01931.1 MAG: hypothetical protein DRQ42_02015 [Gammaproteobacteria bacterium]
MSDIKDDTGIIAVLLDRLEKWRLPKLLALKEKVGAGERLDNDEIDFLEQAITDARDFMSVIDRHPEYQSLATQIITLYSEISEKALQIEKES